ncbi:MAG: hypothetical protein AMXMBFR13_39300 [Phycisphaerae bacterium]
MAIHQQCGHSSEGHGRDGHLEDRSVGASDLPDEGRIARAWRGLCGLIARNRFAIAIASLVWLIWRSGSQPRRLAYPCQQAASANLGALAVLLVPALAKRRNQRTGRRYRRWELAAGSVVLSGLLFVLVSAGITAYSNYTSEASTPALLPWTPETPTSPLDLSSRVLLPNDDEAVVAVNRHTGVTYGTQPYGPGENTAYNLIEQTVRDLHLGTADNPLANLVQDRDGDGVVEVLIKPNTVQYYPDIGGDRSPVYSHPATIRPLIDMAVQAGAQQIHIGDGSNASGTFLTHINPMGYTQAYLDQLRALHPGVTLQYVDLANRGHWSWVGLGTQAGGGSVYADSGYNSSNLLKSTQDASSAYFSANDSHGRPGPSKFNCMGWLAISDYVLEADVIIDLAKLKVHYLGINTAAVKNWVGISMFSTFNSEPQYWCRMSHQASTYDNYTQSFGNDILWREIADSHRGALYWRDGVTHSTPQRAYLCILDAIVCAEKWHVDGPEPPQPRRLDTVLAGVDPISLDAVGGRLQRFDFRRIPIVNNAHAVSIGSNWAFGTADPAKVRIVGDTPINASYAHAFLFDTRLNSSMSWPDFNATVINDLTPPTVNAATVQELGSDEWQIQAHVTDGHVAFVYYGDDGTGAPQVVRLGKSGNDYTATVTGPLGNIYGVAQDHYFNTTRFQFLNVPVIEVSPTTFDREGQVDYNIEQGDTFTVRNIGADTLTYTITSDQTWLQVDSAKGDLAGETDTIAILCDTSDLDYGTHTATISVAGNAYNSPQTVTFTVQVKAVIPDANRDGDVDMSDFGAYQLCLGAPGIAPPEGCLSIDPDTDVDQADVLLFRTCLSGENITAPQGCAPLR